MNVGDARVDAPSHGLDRAPGRGLAGHHRNRRLCPGDDAGGAVVDLLLHRLHVLRLGVFFLEDCQRVPSRAQFEGTLGL